MMMFKNLRSHCILAAQKGASKRLPHEVFWVHSARHSGNKRRPQTRPESNVALASANSFDAMVIVQLLGKTPSLDGDVVNLL